MKRFKFILLLLMPMVALAKDNLYLSLDTSWKDIDKNQSGYAHFTFVGQKTGNGYDCIYAASSLVERQENGAKLYSLDDKNSDTKTCNSPMTSCQCKIFDNQMVFSESTTLAIDKGNPLHHNCQFEIGFVKNETPLAKFLPTGSLAITDFSGVCSNYGDSAKNLIQYSLIKEKEQIPLDGKLTIGGNSDLESLWVTDAANRRAINDLPSPN